MHRRPDGPGPLALQGGTRARDGRRIGWRHCATAALCVAFLASASAAARAERLPSNDFAIDLFQGPILAPIRVTGIAGAYAGYAEGIEGMVTNAAAPAVREPWSASWAEADVAASVSIPLSIFENNDFDNSNEIDSDFSNFIYLTGGALVQLGPVGLGSNIEFQRYALTGGPQQDVTQITVGKYHALGAVRLLGDQLMVGAGTRIVTLGLDAPEASLTIAGLAPEVGVLVRPDWKSFRVGATYRFPVDAGELLGEARTVDSRGRERAGGLVLPDSVVLPWELEVGVAIQVGPRPLSPEWIDPGDQKDILEERLEERRAARSARQERELAGIADPASRDRRARAMTAEEERQREAEEEALDASLARLKRDRRARYWNWPRHHLLLTAEVLVTGAVDRGVTLAGFLGQNQPGPCSDRPPALRAVCEAELPALPGSSGRTVNFSPRFGIETEPVPDLVKTRFGSYYEPNRLDDDRVGRQHFTFGGDLRVFKTTWWSLVPEVIYKLQASFDIAPRYQSFSFGVGVWH